MDSLCESTQKLNLRLWYQFSIQKTEQGARFVMQQLKHLLRMKVLGRFYFKDFE